MGKKVKKQILVGDFVCLNEFALQKNKDLYECMWGFVVNTYPRSERLSTYVYVYFDLNRCIKLPVKHVDIVVPSRRHLYFPVSPPKVVDHPIWPCRSFR
jgi:hypothetical protein